jgi:FkbM family methyltransferase
MSLLYKARRLLRFGRVLGYFEAARFEVLWSLRRKFVTVKIPSIPDRFTLRRFSSDIAVFSQIFVDRELEAYSPILPRFIIDAGANIGLSSAFYAHKYPDATVVAVEPSSENCAAWRHNCRGFSNTRLIEGGLWPNGGFLRIANPEAQAWAYFCESAVDGDPGAFRAYTIDELIDSTGNTTCDLVKLDVEGVEGALFAPNAIGWLSRTKAILVEIHSEIARNVILAACPKDLFEQNQCGEKVLLKRLDLRASLDA